MAVYGPRKTRQRDYFDHPTDLSVYFNHPPDVGTPYVRWDTFGGGWQIRGGLGYARIGMTVAEELGTYTTSPNAACSALMRFTTSDGGTGPNSNTGFALHLRRTHITVPNRGRVGYKFRWNFDGRLLLTKAARSPDYINTTSLIDTYYGTPVAHQQYTMEFHVIGQRLIGLIDGAVAADYTDNTGYNVVDSGGSGFSQAAGGDAGAVDIFEWHAWDYVNPVMGALG